MSVRARPEVWLRGPIDDIGAGLQPVAHALLQAREDLERLVPSLARDELWTGPGSAAPIGFHLRHLAGALDRLCTYARGEALSEEQAARLRAERDTETAPEGGVLLAAALAAIDAALAQLRGTPDEILGDERLVGRALLPSTVRGLLFHAAEHTTRHVGQIATLVKVLRAPATAG